MRKIAGLVAALSLLAIPAAGAQEEVEVVDIMVFTETAGFRHGSIPSGVTMMQRLADSENLPHVDFELTHVANSKGDGPVPGAPTVNYFFGQVNPSHAIANATGGGLFTDEGLARFDVVVWISNTGDVLDDAEQAAFERYIQRGGGYVGIHAAGDSDRAWDWYEDMVGGQFRDHPAGTPTATIDVEDASHASTAHLPTRWTRVDEWYNYQQNPRSYPCFSDATKTCGVRVLLRMDETTYNAGAGRMGNDHPIAWCNEWDGGRAWYTGLGHTNESYSEPHFVAHVLGGILTAADVTDPADPAGGRTTCEPLRR
jgi:cytochrome c